MRGSITFPIVVSGGTTRQPQWFLDSITNLHLYFDGTNYYVDFNVNSGTSEFSYQAMDNGSAQRIIAKINSLIQGDSTAETPLVDVASPTISGASFDGTILTVTGTALLGAAFITIFQQSGYPVTIGSGVQFQCNSGLGTDTNAQTYAVAIPSGTYDVQLSDSSLNPLVYASGALTV